MNKTKVLAIVAVKDKETSKWSILDNITFETNEEWVDVERGVMYQLQNKYLSFKVLDYYLYAFMTN